MFLPNTASTNFSRLREQKEFMRVQKEFRRCSAPSIVLSTGPGEDTCEQASQPSQNRKGQNSMKPENEAVPAMKLMKLRIATGLGFLLFMATMIGGPAGVSRAQAHDGSVTLASLAGNFASRTSGSFTLCFNESFTEAVDCASALHQEVHFKLTSVGHGARDAAGNSC